MQGFGTSNVLDSIDTDPCEDKALFIFILKQEVRNFAYVCVFMKGEDIYFMLHED